MSIFNEKQSENLKHNHKPLKERNQRRNQHRTVCQAQQLFQINHVRIFRIISTPTMKIHNTFFSFHQVFLL